MVSHRDWCHAIPEKSSLLHLRASLCFHLPFLVVSPMLLTSLTWFLFNSLYIDCWLPVTWPCAHFLIRELFFFFCWVLTWHLNRHLSFLRVICLIHFSPACLTSVIPTTGHLITDLGSGQLSDLLHTDHWIIGYCQLFLMHCMWCAWFCLCPSFKTA